MGPKALVKGASFAALVLLSACAGAQARPEPDKVATAAKTEKLKDGKEEVALDLTTHKVICTLEVPLGSHIPEKVCRRLEDIEADRQKTRDDVEHVPGAGNQAIKGQ